MQPALTPLDDINSVRDIWCHNYQTYNCILGIKLVQRGLLGCRDWGGTLDLLVGLSK